MNSLTSIALKTYGRQIDVLDIVPHWVVDKFKIDALTLAQAIRFEGIEQVNISHVLNDICRRGMLEKGTYSLSFKV